MILGKKDKKYVEDLKNRVIELSVELSKYKNELDKSAAKSNKQILIEMMADLRFNGTSLTEIAEVLGKSRSYISGIYNGRTSISENTADLFIQKLRNLKK